MKSLLVALILTPFMISIAKADADFSLRLGDDGVSLYVGKYEYHKLRKHCKKPWNKWEDECRWYRRHKHELRRMEEEEGLSLEFRF